MAQEWFQKRTLDDDRDRVCLLVLSLRTLLSQQTTDERHRGSIHMELTVDVLRNNRDQFWTSFQSLRLSLECAFCDVKARATLALPSKKWRAPQVARLSQKFDTWWNRYKILLCEFSIKVPLLDVVYHLVFPNTRPSFVPQATLLDWSALPVISARRYISHHVLFYSLEKLVISRAWDPPDSWRCFPLKMLPSPKQYI